MAWNGSGNGATSAATNKKIAKPRKASSGAPMSGAFKGALALILVLAILGGLAYVYLTNEEIKAKIDQKIVRTARIAEFKPNAIDYLNPSAEEKSALADEIESFENANNANKDKTDIAVQPVFTNHVSEVATRSRFDIFKHESENHLAFLACAPFGTMIIGGFDYDEAFIEDLKDAFKEEIEILPDDPEDIKGYKNAVIAMKKELRAMMNRGEDVSEALAAARRDLQEMGQYKAELETQIRKIQVAQGDIPEDDFADLIDAANLMLQDKGIEPFAYSKILGEIIKFKPFASPEEQAAEEEDVLEAEEAAGLDNQGE